MPRPPLRAQSLRLTTDPKSLTAPALRLQPFEARAKRRSIGSKLHDYIPDSSRLNLSASTRPRLSTGNTDLTNGRVGAFMQCQTEAFEAAESEDGVGGSSMTMTLRTGRSRRRMLPGGWSRA